MMRDEVMSQFGHFILSETLITRHLAFSAFHGVIYGRFLVISIGRRIKAEYCISWIMNIF